MSQIVIENPIINSPFVEPQRHFKFDENGITDTIIVGRRLSEYFIPVPPPVKRGAQMDIDPDWVQAKIEENKLINQIRIKVAQWRKGGYQGITSITRKLLEHWTHPKRERKLFFCQIEALETAIYIAEVADKVGDHFVRQSLAEFNQDANPGLFRIAFKMATGSGKTVVMAMLIAWQTLNKVGKQTDLSRSIFTNDFLIVTPGITIRDRLRVLHPNDPENYFHKLDIVPPGNLQEELNQANVIITNYHAFLLREKDIKASTMTKQIASGGDAARFTETPAEMVNRVLKTFKNKRQIIVFNDEAHHCYRRKPEIIQEKLTGDDKNDAKKREEEARVWISGLEAIQNKIGIKTVYDLSATPFFLKGSGYSKQLPNGKYITEGILFPWVVSDFSLIDAIESGIVKVPRVPVKDSSMKGDEPTYRNIWLKIKDQLPKKGRGTKDESADQIKPIIPKELDAALHSLYGHYEAEYKEWENDHNSDQQTPPVFIVVCVNTNISKMVFDHLAGYDTGKQNPDGSPILAPGDFPLFSNVDHNVWRQRPNTILVDSEQLESGETMSKEFKDIARVEIDEFKAEYRKRYPDRDVSKISDEDLLREVVNTVGKPGKLGGQIRCVVSVSMLTEGWDANTVTHILGVRPFGTQLLSEQVVGRGLRRISYQPITRQFEVNEQTIEIECFEPDYADIYGVPFKFFPCSGIRKKRKKRDTYHIKALEERIGCEITFPRVIGYRYEIAHEKLRAHFTADAVVELSTKDIPVNIENAPIVGEKSYQNLDDLKKHRPKEVEFLIAKLVLEKYFQNKEGEIKQWLFPQILDITRQWLKAAVVMKDDTFVQMLLLVALAHRAADKIYGAIVVGTPEEKVLMPVIAPYDPIGSSKYVDFETVRRTYQTKAEKCHVNLIAIDSDWEAKLAASLEEMDEVVHYIKNDHLRFQIPYTLDNKEHHYVPDFIVRINDGQPDLLNLILEVSGEPGPEKQIKCATARNFWVASINNHGEFGRWDFIEISDPYECKRIIREYIISKKR